ncbi:MAG TPA: signal peptidase II [Terriglobales bacterium]|nr:signal peptidase II [Terriglobales bacterium]
MRRTLLPVAVVAAAIVALDRWTKAWASRALPFDHPVRILDDFVRLTYTRNSGVAFGIGQGTGFPYYWLSLLAIVAILWMFWRGRRAGSGRGMPLARRLSLALVLGGAIGNLVDRVASGEVVDFIEVGIPRWHWPVFNVADSAVTIGVLVLALTWSRGREPAWAGPGYPPAKRVGPDAPGDEPARPAGPGDERRGAPGPLPGGGAEEPLP